jgi:hypothetical protein
MLTENEKVKGASLALWTKWVAVGVLLAITAAAAVGCSQKKVAVCQGKSENLVLVPSTSISDLETDRLLAPRVTEQIVERAAESCGSITVGLQNNRPTADLELVTLELSPARDEAFNRNPDVRDMVEDGTAFVEKHLLEPLSKVQATDGSPFLGTLVRIRDELDVHGLIPATIVLLGDGISVEEAPNGEGYINFTHETVDADLVRAFEPLLRPLTGSCVMLLGAGADSELPDSRLREARAILGKTIENAGGKFVATRSPDLPASCN